MGVILKIEEIKEENGINKKLLEEIDEHLSSVHNLLNITNPDSISGAYWDLKWEIKFKDSLELSGYEDLPFKTNVIGKYTRLFSEDLGYSISEHRYVMSKKLNRNLETRELVHHIDRDKYNNDPENLMIVTAKEHSQIHKK